MGVSGLSTYIKDHVSDALVWYKLYNCNVVIDGNNLAHVLYHNGSGINSAFGGDYDKYSHYVKLFFDALLKCNVTPLVVLDGGREVDGRKLGTVLSRMADQVQSCNRVNPVNQFVHKIFPLHASNVFIQVLKDLKIRHVQCDFEADQEIAVISKQMDCHVISNDSDFYMFGTSFILLDSLNYTNIQSESKENGDSINYIPCYLFDVDKFCKITKLPSKFLVVFGTILGNDYISVPELKNFFSDIETVPTNRRNFSKRQSTILSVIKWLITNELCTPQEIISKVVACFPTSNQESIEAKLNSTYINYDPSSSQLIPYLTRHSTECHCFATALSNYFQSSEMDNFKCGCEDRITWESSLTTKNGNSLPLWFLKSYRTANIVSEIADILTKDYFISKPQIEVKYDPCSYLIAEPVIIIISKLLLCLSTNGKSYDKKNHHESQEEEWQIIINKILDLCNLKTSDYSSSQPSNGNEEFSSLVTANASFCVKWYIRNKGNFQAKNTFFSNLNTSLPSLNDLHNFNDSKRKQLLLNLLKIDVETNDVVDEIEFVIIAICFWYKHSKFSIKAYHLHTLIMCMVMFSIIDGKKRFRSKSSFEDIKKIEKRHKESLSNSNNCFNNCDIKTLVSDLTDDECRLVSYKLFQYHHLDSNITFKNYDKALVHIFSEFQACLYFLHVLNSLLCNPYIILNMDRVWNGTFSYNIFTRFEIIGSSIGFVEYLFDKNSRIYFIYDKLYKKIFEYLNIEEKSKAKINISKLKTSKKNKAKKPKITKASKLRSLEELEVDRQVSAIENNMFYQLSLDDC